jgi:transketolase
VHAKALTDFVIGRGIVLSEGADVCLLSTGNMLEPAVKAGELLRARGVTTRVVSFHTVKPLDEALLMDAFSRFKAVVTIEEHSRLGGLGGSVAEWLADHPGLKARLVRVGTDDAFLHAVGEQEFARARYGLTAEAIAAKAASAAAASAR